MLRNATIVFLVQATGAAISFVFQLYVANMLSTSNYGVFGLALTWLSILLMIASLGFQTAFLKRLPLYAKNKNPQCVSDYVSVAIFCVIVVTFAVSLIYLQILKHAGSEYSVINLYFLAVVLLLSATMMNLSKVIAQCVFAAHVAVFPLALVVPLLNLLFIFVVNIYYQEQLVVVDILSMIAVSYCVVIFIYSGMFWNTNIKSWKINKFQIHFARKWLSESLPMMSSGAMQILFKHVDIVMLGFLTASTISVGMYFAVVKINLILLLGLNAVNSIVAPKISRAYREDRLNFQKMITRACRILFFFSAFVLLILVVFGKDILALFGSDYVGGYIALIILCFGNFINAITGPVGYVLNLTNHHLASVRIVVLALLLNIALNFLLIPSFGIVGAAIATSVSVSMRNVIMAAFAMIELEYVALLFNEFLK